ncbi:MAG: DsbC family protein [Steroidobacteraceae bacterium]
MRSLAIALASAAAVIVAPLALAAVAGAGGSAKGMQSSPRSAQAAAQRDPRAAIVKAIPGTTPEDVHATPIPGLYEIMRGTDAAYVSADGRYAIAGDLYDLRSNVDLTESQRRQMRLKLLATIPESQMLIFGAPDSAHTVTVFTDVDCAYCRKFHSEIAEYNRLGIRVRYLFYPRTGPNTQSWLKAEEVWCSPDRKQALTRAKLGEALHVKLCANTPVALEYQLGQELDLVGTPAIILANGDLLPGYVSPTDLAQALRSVAH